MLSLVLNEQKKKKNIGILIGIFIFIYGLYLFLDILAFGSFAILIDELGYPLFFGHQVLNVIMASLTSTMVSLSQIKLRLTKSEPVGSNAIPFLSFIFGLLTFGCAPCVVAFFAAIGIAFTPIVFPHGNLLWKFILLALIIVGFVWILYSINKGVCKPKLKKSEA